ncbi:MAG: carboxypeptidase-like regulatory domain-containing protein, partial [Bacteroidota bacterium]
MNKQYMLLSLSLLAFAFGLGWTMYDDPLTIKGYVRDAETQEPLIGATILIKGTNNGALTDINGFYQLRVPDEHKSGTLVVSFIGYRQQEFPIKNRNKIDVNLQQSIVTLDEAVVTSAATTRTRTKKARRPKRDKSLREADILKSSPPPPPPPRVSKDEESGEADQYYETPVPPPPPASAALPDAAALSPTPKVRIKPE